MIKLKGALSVRSIYGAMRELRGAGEGRPIVLAGAPVLTPLLAKDLREGGEHDAVREGGAVADAAVLIYVLPGEPSDGDLQALRSADRADVPIVCVARPGVDDVPYVLATDLLHAEGGSGFPVDEIVRAVARKLGVHGSGLARRLPALRPAVCEELVRRLSRQNGLIGAAVFVPGVDMPILTMNQIRLVLRIAHAYGEEPDRERALELLGVVAAGYGFRSVARSLAGLVPGAGWAVKGGVAYGGTRAIGEAAVAYFEAGAPAALPSSA